MLTNLLLLLLVISSNALAQYDVVIKGGRVIDPETRLDAIRNVGIAGGRIVAISAEELKGREIIDATGLVVSPGFIDLHSHGITNKENEYQSHDGVTTALELEGGVHDIAGWFERRSGKALINYGASADFGSYRALSIRALAGASEKELGEKSPYTSLTDDEVKSTIEKLTTQLNDGAIGIGIPIGYIPKATREEIYRIYQFAAEKQVPIFSHIRDGKAWAVQQAIADAMLTGASLHIVHLNSSALDEISLAMEMITSAQRKGFDITTEMYPFTAASTSLESALFDEGWKEKWNISYGDLQWVATGERLTEQTFNEYRKKGGIVIIHLMKPDWIRAGIANPITMIASDAMPYAPLAHPRTAGTFARVLGKYVRDEKVISLAEAISKMTLMPAQRLERIAPAARFKGRIQVGCDADITVFNPATVTDKATFEAGLKFSDGVQFVLVNGVAVVRKGNSVADVYPGKPLFGKLKR